MPEAKLGDWDYNIKSQKNFSKKYNLLVQDLTKFKFTKNIGKYKLYVHQRPSEIILVIGYFFKDDFIVLCEGKLKKYKTIFENTYQMYSIKTFLFAKRCQGLATAIYLHCLNEMGIKIVSDGAQYDGARKIYKVLIDRYGINGSLVDELKTIKKNIRIKNIFDETIWFIRGKFETRENKDNVIILSRD